MENICKGVWNIETEFDSPCYTELALNYYKEQKKYAIKCAVDLYEKHIGVISYFNQLLNSIGLEKWVKIVEAIGCDIHGGVFSTETKKMLSALDTDYMNCVGCSVNRVRNMIFRCENKQLLDNIAKALIKGAMDMELSENVRSWLLAENVDGKPRMKLTGRELWDIIFKDRWEISESGECWLVIHR